MFTSDRNQALAVTDAGAGSNLSDDQSGSYDTANAAAVELVNSMGGIAGRRIEPVYAYFNPASWFSREGRQQENQRACARFTEDHEVFAISGFGYTEEVMLECAARTKTPLVGVRQHVHVSQSRFTALSDYWYGPHSFVTDRRERALATFLLENGFFGKRAKVALLIDDTPSIREGVRGMKPVLASAGIEPAVEIVYPDHSEAPWSNYVLQLQMEGITHVLWSTVRTGPFAPLLMMRAAEDQRYRPMWAMGSEPVLAVLPALGAPPEQLENVRAMGWKPRWDVGDLSPQSENARRCTEQVRRHTTSEDDVTTGLEVCEFLLFLRAAFERAEVVSASGLAAGVERLGDSYSSTMAIGGATRFGAGRHDGAAVVRSIAYDRAAAQFKYTSDPEPAPG